jgi:hypothetical protein
MRKFILFRARTSYFYSPTLTSSTLFPAHQRRRFYFQVSFAEPAPGAILAQEAFLAQSSLSPRFDFPLITMRLFAEEFKLNDRAA